MRTIVLGLTMSLDGFINDRNGSVAALYHDLAFLVSTESFQHEIAATGAVVMGRRAYEMGQGDFTGYEFQTPIFVLTHHPPETPARGENDRLRFHFVTDGAPSAVAQAKAAAGDRDVMIIGGASTARQCLTAGLVNEVRIAIRPLLLGDGTRLFDRLDAAPVELEQIGIVEYPMMTELRYRVVPNGFGLPSPPS